MTLRGEKRVDKLMDSDFRWVEKLLYQQKTHNTAIAELEAELEDMLPSCSTSIVRFSHDKPHRLNSQPEAGAIKLNDSMRAKEIHGEIRRRKRHKVAISAARESLTDEENQFVWLFYDLGKSIRDCRRTLHYQKSKMYDMRKEIVYKVADFLGIRN